MKITEVRVHLDPSHTRVVAFAEIILDGCFRVSEIKIIKGDWEDRLLVAMPNRPIKIRCLSCRRKCPYRDRFCGGCGKSLVNTLPPYPDDSGRVRQYIDICHPINSECRQYIDKMILEEYDRVGERESDGMDDDLPGSREDGVF